MNNELTQSIKIHDTQAKYYKYRTPYISELFIEIEKKVQISNQSILLDLCCGCGEISKGFAKGKCKKIYALDGSKEMLNLAYINEKIEYSCIDINSKLFECPEPVNLFVIGRAIHWIEPSKLLALVNKNLNNNGAIVILSTQWSSDEKWFQIYKSITRKYLQPIEIVKKITSRDLDFTGQKTMQEIGFKRLENISIRRIGQFDINWLTNHVLSNNYAENLINLEINLRGFKTEMHKKLSPFLTEGRLFASFTSWAIIFGPR
jgi:ubiquinone/menaquinone biosynthesis C-methylase UbiE